MSQSEHDLTAGRPTGRVLSWPGRRRAPTGMSRRLEQLKERRCRAEARIKTLDEQRAETEKTLQETADAIRALEEALDDDWCTTLTW